MNNICIFNRLVLVAAFLCAGAIHAGDDLTVYARSTTFANPVYDSLVKVEFPLSLNRNEFVFDYLETDSVRLYARIFVQVCLIDSVGMPVDSVSDYFMSRVNSRQEAADRDFRIFHCLIMAVRPGKYSARVSVIDAFDKSTGEAFISEFVVKPPEKDKLSIDGCYLAYSAEYVGRDTAAGNRRLAKNGYQIIPNPASVFDSKDSVIWVYGEVYNLFYSPTDYSKYVTTYTVLDDLGLEFRQVGRRVGRKPGNTAVLVEEIDIKGWPSGLYSLRIEVVDSASMQTDVASLPFRIISDEELSLVQERWDAPDAYDTLTLKHKVNLVRFVLDSDQLSTLKRLNDTGKESFLKQYWKEHDENPATEIIENRIELMNRYFFAVREYSTNYSQDDGWQRDRGRVLMKYGVPDEIDDDRLLGAVDPLFEIWYYYFQQKKKMFIFLLYRGDSDMRLVHSDALGEIFSRDWDEYVRSQFADESSPSY